ncbi:DUF11 domain-containing protein [Paucibacter sp. Y2R2-4]|uniref:DUF11 domain-containing protein n=1 Tax=Paucibacter sp. Y2R2-4 TaxID=2893553 RepID=UPI0021E3B907|nr:DUF11 domain-containing protein [Paucibacter sp. Y2R2-4]MCV2350126.1 DUF11 domain-containing protein [Paucibacter sp. Y2R2-4]
MDKQATPFKTSPRLRPLLAVASLSAAALLSACGGGGGGGEVTPPPPVDAAEVSVSIKPAGNPIPSGNTQTMATVKLSNVGKGVAGSTDFSVSADAVLLDFKVVRCSSDNAGSACPAGGGSRILVSNLQPGATLTFDVEGQIKAGTSGTVNMSAAASTSNGGQLSSSSQSVGVKAYSVDVGVQATGPTVAVPAGGNFEYVITLSNQGPDTATDVPVGLLFTSTPAENAPTLGTITCSATGAAVCPSTLSSPLMTVPSLPKGETVVIKLPYQFAAGKSAGLVFGVKTRVKGDSNSGNDEATVLTPQ